MKSAIYVSAGERDHDPNRSLSLFEDTENPNVLFLEVRSDLGTIQIPLPRSLVGKIIVSSTCYDYAFKS